MFALATRSAFKQTLVLPTAVRSVATIARDSVTPATASGSSAAGIKTSTTVAAAPTMPRHIVDNGRVTSINRTYHYSTSWEGSDMPAPKKDMSKAEQQRRIKQLRNAMELL